MNWNMMNLAVKRLNPSALKDWKETFLSMDAWMQAVVVGALVLLAGVSVLSCWWGLKMNRYAKFAAGAAGLFHIMLIILAGEYQVDTKMAFLYAALAGVAAGFLYAFLERFFQFVAGFVFGTVLSAWVLPTFVHLKMSSGKGRIWGLVIAIGVGVLFALLAKRFRMVLTSLEGGVVLGLLCDAFLPVTDIPWIKDRLTGDQIRNLLPLVLAGTGLLAQFLQWISVRAEQKALQIPTGDERDHAFGKEDGKEKEEADASPTEEDEDAVSMAQAEEVLVEKAKELALAAARNAQQARLKERYQDVSEGLYSAQAAASRLDMTEEAFLQGMKKAGYTVPGEAAEEAGEPEETQKQEAPQEDGKSQTPAKDAEGGEEEKKEQPSEDEKSQEAAKGEEGRAS